MIDVMVSQRLDDLIKGSRLSMNQIAGKWGVSAPLLSQIKNGKKKPSLELGLRILRESGASLEERKRWVEERHAEGQELGRIYRDERKETVEFALKKSLGDLFESTPVLMDLFLDISLMKDKGLSWNGVFKHYGEYGLELAATLIDSGLVKKEGDRYYIIQEEFTHIIDTENSLGIMKSVFEVLKQKYKREGFKGEFNFLINDISPQAYQQLKDLNVEYAKKADAIINANELPRMKGGLRVVSQNIVSLLKCFAFIFLLGSSFLQETQAQGSGLGGGGSGKIVEGAYLSVKDLRRVINANMQGIPRPERTNDIRIRSFSETYTLEYNTTAMTTPLFKTKQEVIDAIVKLNERLSEGAINDEEARHLSRNLSIRCKSSRGGSNFHVKRAMEKAFKEAGIIKPLGFNIHDSYSPQGEPRYSGVAAYNIPCEEAKD